MCELLNHAKYGQYPLAVVNDQQRVEPRGDLNISGGDYICQILKECGTKVPCTLGLYKTASIRRDGESALTLSVMPAKLG